MSLRLTPPLRDIRPPANRAIMDRRAILVALGIAVATACFPVCRAVAADEIDDTPTREVLFNKAEAAQVSARLQAEARSLRTFAACPADAFGRERPFWRGFATPKPPSERTCAQHPAGCYDLCMGWANGPACFDLALAYEHHSLDVPDALDKERLYALACALGFPAGCTNRAAGIRNGDYVGDPFRDTSLATKQACQARSFQIDCDRRGAWGCAMLGQAYRNGEGVVAQPERAKAAFEASCQINPKFAACTFAKGYLDKLNRSQSGIEEIDPEDD